MVHGRIPKTENRKPKTWTGLIFLVLALGLLTAACGKKMVPLSPDQVLPAPVREFKLTQEGDSLVLSWLLPRVNLLGQPLTQVQGCRVYRAEVRGVSPDAPCPSTGFVLYADIDLAYPLKGEVHGEALLFQDRDLAPDHRYYYRVAAYGPGRLPGGLVPHPESRLGLAAANATEFQGRARRPDGATFLGSGYQAARRFCGPEPGGLSHLAPIGRQRLDSSGLSP